MSVSAGGPFGSLNAYWGQWGGYRLRDVCNSGVQYATVSFVTKSPENGNGYPGTNFGANCASDVYYNNGQKTELQSSCDLIKEDIIYCQSMGVKVLLSVGGAPIAGVDYRVTNASMGINFADFLYNAFGPYQSNWTGPRPFDISTTEHIALDGFDLDLEDSKVAIGPYMAMVERWRSLESNLFITAAPQCVTDQNHLDCLINGTRLDALFVQFYNNPVCDAVPGNTPGDEFSYDKWVSRIQGGKSKDVMIFIGLPASPDAAGNGYITHAELRDLVCKHRGQPNFGGISLWDAKFALDNEDSNNKSYLQVAAEALQDECNTVATTTSSTDTPTDTESTSTMDSTSTDTLEETTATSSATTASTTDTPTDTDTFGLDISNAGPSSTVDSISTDTPEDTTATSSDMTTSTTDTPTDTDNPNIDTPDADTSSTIDSIFTDTPEKTTTTSLDITTSTTDTPTDTDTPDTDTSSTIDSISTETAEETATTSSDITTSTIDTLTNTDNPNIDTPNADTSSTIDSTSTSTPEDTTTTNSDTTTSTTDTLTGTGTHDSDINDTDTSEETINSATTSTADDPTGTDTADTDTPGTDNYNTDTSDIDASKETTSSATTTSTVDTPTNTDTPNTDTSEETTSSATTKSTVDTPTDTDTSNTDSSDTDTSEEMTSSAATPSDTSICVTNAASTSTTKPIVSINSQWSNSTTTSQSVFVATSMVLTAKTKGCTSCTLSSVTDGAKGQVTTETTFLSTTSNLATQTVNSPLPYTTKTPLWTTSTVYTTKIHTIKACPPYVSNCSKRTVTTEVIAMKTTFCIVTEAETGSTASPAEKTGTVMVGRSSSSSSSRQTSVSSTGAFPQPSCEGSRSGSGCTEPNGPEVANSTNSWASTATAAGRSATPSHPLVAGASTLVLGLIGLVAIVAAQILVL